MTSTRSSAAVAIVAVDRSAHPKADAIAKTATPARHARAAANTALAPWT